MSRFTGRKEEKKMKGLGGSADLFSSQRTLSPTEGSTHSNNMTLSLGNSVLIWQARECHGRVSSEMASSLTRDQVNCDTQTNSSISAVVFSACLFIKSQSRD